jgi:hypothetical protein
MGGVSFFPRFLGREAPFINRKKEEESLYLAQGNKGKRE